MFSSRKDLGVSGLHKQQQAGIFRAGSPDQLLDTVMMDFIS
jgi:hypothetical protein